MSSPPPNYLAAAAVGWGPRVMARLFNAVPSVVLFGVYGWSVGALADDPSNTGPYVALLVVGIIAALIGVAQLVLIFTQSRTIGSMLAGFEYRSVETGKRAGLATFLQLLVTEVLLSVSFGLAAILYLITYRDGQCLADRWMKIVAVRPSEIVQPKPARRPGPANGQQVGPTAKAPETNAWPAASAAPVAPAPGALPWVPSAQPSARPAGWGAPPAPVGSGQPPAAASPGWGTPSAAPAQGGLIDSTPFRPRATAAPASPVPPPVSPMPSPAPAPSAVPQAPVPTAPPAPVPSPTPASQAPPPAAPVPSPAPAPVPSPPAPVPSPAPAPVPSPAMLNDDTVLDAVLVAPRIEFDGGEVVVIDRPLVFGRNPMPPASHPAADRRALTDETMKMSKTHAVVLAEGRKVQVFDAGARNGVVFEIEGQRSRIAPGQAVEVPAEARVHFGGRSFRVLP